MNPQSKVRCAIYTRKSHEDGLELDYNSLDAQWDSAAHYIQSQKAAGWERVNERYDDGGFSGGTLERPALQRLLEDVRAGKIDVIVVYRMDRLTRAIFDFSKLAEVFDQHGVNFVSVTEHFNTTTPMGRLTLNMVLSFAQFEREVIGERIRDKFAASKKKGMWMGGVPPLGYDVKDRKLVINAHEAKIVRFIFDQYLNHGSRVRLVGELEQRCYRGKSWTTQEGNVREGGKISALLLHKILTNSIYKGKIHHRGELYDGEHEAIIAPETWDAVEAQLKAQAPKQRQAEYKTEVPFLLRGVIFDQHGCAMTPSYSQRRRKHYRYYVNTKAIREGYAATELSSIPAEQIEPIVIAHMRQFFLSPEIVHQTHQAAQAQQPAVTLEDVREGLTRFNGLWDQLFPAEQNRIVQLVIHRIQVGLHGIDITYQPNGIKAIYEEVTNRASA